MAIANQKRDRIQMSLYLFYQNPIMEFISLELELSVERLKRYLQKHPEEAFKLAVSYFEDFSVLAIEHKRLEQNYQALQIENICLKSSTNHQLPSLPFFLNSKQGVS